MKRGPDRRSLENRFFDRLILSDYCWDLTGAVNSAGYLRIATGGHQSPTLLAHRVSYELFVGPIPDGLFIDHLCSNKRCVNPTHLEPVTLRENTRRYWEATRATV